MELSKIRKAIDFLDWPEWYSPCLTHMNFFFKKVGSPLVFYYSAEDTPIFVERIDEMINNPPEEFNWDDDMKENAVEAWEDLKKTLKGFKGGAMSIVDEETGNGFMIDTTIYLVNKIMNNKPVRPDSEVVEKNYKDIYTLKGTRTRVPEIVRNLLDQVESMEKRPSEPKRHVEKVEDWKTDIINDIKTYYSLPKNIEGARKKLEDYVSDIVKDGKSSSVVYSIRSPKQSPRANVGRTGIVAKEKFIIKSPGMKDKSGFFVMFERNMIVSENSTNERFKEYGKKYPEAHDFEIKETFKQFYNLIFGSNESIKVGDYTIIRESSVEKPKLLEDKFEETIPVEDVEHVVLSKPTLPVYYSNIQKGDIEKALAVSKTLETDDKKSRVRKTQEEAERFINASRPNINASILEAKKTEGPAREERAAPSRRRREVVEEYEMDFPSIAVSRENAEAKNSFEEFNIEEETY